MREPRQRGGGKGVWSLEDGGVELWLENALVACFYTPTSSRSIFTSVDFKGVISMSCIIWYLFCI